MSNIVRLAEWIRWNDRSAAAHENGLTPESVEIQGISRWYVKHFFGKEDVMSEVLREKTVKLVETQVQECAGWILISSRGTSSHDLIQVGWTLWKVHGYVLVRGLSHSIP